MFSFVFLTFTETSPNWFLTENFFLLIGTLATVFKAKKDKFVGGPYVKKNFFSLKSTSHFCMICTFFNRRP